MTRIVGSLTAAFSLALVAFAPAAMANHNTNQQAPKNVVHRHFLKLYKVERVIDIETEDYAHNSGGYDAHVYCDENNPNIYSDNDLAVDGMWKVVDVDQGDDGSRDLTSVKVYASYRDHIPTANYPGGNPSKWHFEFDNRVDGRAQLKMYATCLGWRTEPNSHQHQWTWSGVHKFTVADPVHAAASQDFFDAPGNTPDCGPGEIAVSPGFQFEDGSPSPSMSTGDIFRSRYFDGTFKSWSWGFWIEPGPYSLQLTFHCLQIKSLFAGSPGHVHRLEYEFEPDFDDLFTTPIEDTDIDPDPDGIGPQQSVGTYVRICNSHYKGMVHSFDLDPYLFGHHLWFLGMDPRIKSRAYKILNSDINVQPAQLGLMCFHDRTWKKQKN